MHDFYSDTKTKPSRAMREAILDAPVGDEQKSEDPTTKALEARVADLLGKEAAVYLPSGTLANEIAIRVHCRPGDEVICARKAHIIEAEGGGPAALSGVMIHPIDGGRGHLTPEQVTAAIRPGNSRYQPRSRLLSVEQTVNLEGGAIWPLDRLNASLAIAKEQGLATHMDGARLMNAVVATGIDAADWCAGVDTVWIDFSKGLGAPVGSALAGSKDFIEAAWAAKQQMGGAMRQSGVLAAMCLYALDHNVDRLAEDHALAAEIARDVAQLPGVAGVLPADTNIVIFDLAEDQMDAADLTARAKSEGINLGVFGARRIRVVTHLDVDAAARNALMAFLRRELS
ncbi:MAG: threonine aldolase family protein [Pseudomonadota bacterium]